MNHTKNRRTSLHMALFIVGLMAFVSAGTAQAAEWRVEGKKLTVNKTATGSVHVETNFKVSKLGLEILCASHTIDEAIVLPSGLVDGSILLTKCKTWQNGKESPACKPIEPVFATGRAKPFLHNGLTYMLVEPTTVGGAYAVAKFSEPCALPETNTVKGTAVGECLNLKLEAGPKYCEEEAKVHLGRQAPQALFPTDQIFFGTNLVTFEGVAAVELTSGEKVAAFG